MGALMYIMAFDIGKTKTLGVLFDEELNIYGYAVGGPADVLFDDKSMIVRNLRYVLNACLVQIGLSLKDVDLLVFSWASLDSEKDYGIAWSCIEELGLPRDKVVIEHDAVAAYYAVTLGEPGVAVIAGTGAIAFGMNEHGERARSSGWGWMIGDEGSASWIGLQALNMASRAYDGRGPWTSLVERIKEFYGVDDLLEVIDRVHRRKSLDISDIAEIAEIVNEEAMKGDDVAKQIMTRAGEELALSAYAVAKKLNMENNDIIVGGVGSVFKSHIVSSVFKSKVIEMMPKARVREPIVGHQAIIGAIVIALRRIGLSITQDMVNRVIDKVRRFEEFYMRS